MDSAGNGFIMLSICVDPLNEGKDSMLVCSHRQRDWGLRKVVSFFIKQAWFNCCKLVSFFIKFVPHGYTIHSINRGSAREAISLRALKENQSIFGGCWTMSMAMAQRLAQLGEEIERVENQLFFPHPLRLPVNLPFRSYHRTYLLRSSNFRFYGMLVFNLIWVGEKYQAFIRFFVDVDWMMDKAASRVLLRLNMQLKGIVM